MRCYDFVPNLLPLFILDVLFRFYSAYAIYSLLLKYRDVQRDLKRQRLEDYENSSNQGDLPAPKTSTMDNNDGVLKVLDNFLFFLKLEFSAYFYAVINILGSLTFLLYRIVYIPIMGGKNGKGVDLKIMDYVVFIVFFVINIAMTISLLVGIKMVSFLIE